MDDYKGQWTDLVAKDVHGQAKFFLQSFVLEFQGNFEEVLDIAQGECGLQLLKAV